MNKLVIKKGYTLEVTSWENDGDLSQTKSKTFDTKEKVTEVYKMLSTLCRSEYDDTTVGNKYCEYGDSEAESCDLIVLRYLIDNLSFVSLFCNETFDKFKTDIEEEFKDYINDKVSWIDCLLEYLEDKPSLYKPYVGSATKFMYELLDSSEYYYSRVFEMGSIYYSPEDIYLEVIDIN